MKVSKAINLFLDYHKMNSQKIRPGLTGHSWANSGPIFLTES
jgi:hypothetical protein